MMKFKLFTLLFAFLAFTVSSLATPTDPKPVPKVQHEFSTNLEVLTTMDLTVPFCYSDCSISTEELVLFSYVEPFYLPTRSPSLKVGWINLKRVKKTNTNLQTNRNAWHDPNLASLKHDKLYLQPYQVNPSEREVILES